MRILLVEDHESTADILMRLIKSLDHIVSAANSIASAKSLAAQQRFDLVVSDLGLPDGSGLELMRYLRAQYGLTGLALTGFGMEDDVRRTREAGFAEHLTKPVEFEQIEAAIERVASRIGSTRMAADGTVAAIGKKTS